jgi:hypothetical protein
MYTNESIGKNVVAGNLRQIGNGQEKFAKAGTNQKDINLSHLQFLNEIFNARHESSISRI